MTFPIFKHGEMLFIFQTQLKYPFSPFPHNESFPLFDSHEICIYYYGNTYYNALKLFIQMGIFSNEFSKGCVLSSSPLYYSESLAWSRQTTNVGRLLKKLMNRCNKNISKLEKRTLNITQENIV